MQMLLEDEVRVSRQDEETQDRRQPTWTRGQMTPSESAMAHHWAPTATTSLRSALLTRAGRPPATRPTSYPLGAAAPSGCLRWTAGSTTSEIGVLLTEGPVKIPEARFTPPSTPYDVGLIQLNEGVLELKGPPS
ncbi:hypothetical protein [Streptomyces goshikiensis]